MSGRSPLRATVLALVVCLSCVRRAPPSEAPARTPSAPAGRATPALSSLSPLSSDEERVVSSLPVVPPDLNAAYTLRTKRSRTVSAVYTCSVRAPNLAAREWVAFVPRPPDLPGQRVLSAATSPPGEVVRDLAPLGRPLLRVRANVEAASPELLRGIDLEMRVEAELYSRRLVEVSGGGPPEEAERLGGNERKLALRPTSQFDYSHPAVRAWLVRHGLNRAEQEGEVDFARRVFLVIARGFRYEYIGEQDRSASHVCTQGKSDCGGMAMLFCAALRSQGVPARVLAGRWAKSANPGERAGPVEYLQEHVKAEFFAPGVGWVPADLSSAVLHDRSPAKLRYFGDDRGDFLTMHVDTGLAFDTLHFGVKTMTYLQRAAYWASGSGDFRGSVAREGWVVAERPGREGRAGSGVRSTPPPDAPR